MGLVFLKGTPAGGGLASLQGLCCLPTFVPTCWAASDLAGIHTPGCIASLKGKRFETDAVFCTQSLENLHWAFHVAAGREMRINRCLWLYHSESCYMAQARLGSLPVTGSAQPCPCWRHVTPEQTQRVQRVPSFSRDPLCHCHQTDGDRSHQSGFAVHSEVLRASPGWERVGLFIFTKGQL